MRSRFAIASLPKTRVRAFGLALIALSSCALAPRAEARWRKSLLLEEIASASAFTQIVEERVGGAVARSYVFGSQRISMRDAGGVHYYGYDAHSGVRALTDASGTVTDTYEYDAFGNLLVRTGTTANDFMYRGEQMDSATGLQYLRQRWRNPGRGGFLSRDTFPGVSFQPFSRHSYLYGWQSPIDHFDPSGRFTLGDVMAAVAVAGIVQNLALGAYHSYRANSADTEAERIQEATLAGQNALGLALALIPGGGIIGPTAFATANGVRFGIGAVQNVAVIGSVLIPIGQTIVLNANGSSSGSNNSGSSGTQSPGSGSSSSTNISIGDPDHVFVPKHELGRLAASQAEQEQAIIDAVRRFEQAGVEPGITNAQGQQRVLQELFLEPNNEIGVLAGC